MAELEISGLAQGGKEEPVLQSYSVTMFVNLWEKMKRKCGML